MRSSTSSVVVAISCIVLSLPAWAAEPQGRPNILLFIGDDIDFSYYGFQGHEFAQTPNLDQLAAEGVVFENGYAPASVCRPSLQSLLAGIRPHTWAMMAETIRADHPGTDLRRESRYVPFTLPRLLRQAGYSSFAGGKMWEGTFDDAGFDAGTMDGPLPRVRVAGDETFGRDSMQELYDFIDSQPGPWFAWVAPKLPHLPLDSPSHLRELYSGLGLLQGAEAYFGNLTRMDLLVGEIRTFLDDRGLSDDTIIIYLADNGWEQRLYPTDEVGSILGDDRGKVSVHDRGFRTPVVVRWPAEVLPGRRTDRVVTFEDVFETILDYADAPSHECSSGMSFRKVADDGRGRRRHNRLLLRMDNVRHSLADITESLADDDPTNDLPRAGRQLGLYLRQGRRWSCSLILERGVEELYDHRDDPMGLEDLSEERPGRLRFCRRRALALNRRIEASRCAIVP